MKHLIVWRKVQDTYGNLVRGHISRTDDIVMALEEISECEVKKSYAFDLREYKILLHHYGESNSVSLIDNGHGFFDIPYNSIVVTDEEEVRFNKQCPYLINTSNKNIHILNNEPSSYILYTGIESSIISPLTRKHAWNPDRNRTVYLIPGGADKQFFHEYNKMGIESILSKYGYRSIVINSLERQDLLERTSKSEFVICTPSVISLEMIAMGVPFLPIQTANDQDAYIAKYNEEGMVTGYSAIDDIESFIQKPAPPPNIVDSQHTYRLAQRLHTLLWRN